MVRARCEGRWFDPGLDYRVVYLDKKLYSVLSLSAQFYKCEPATECWERGGGGGGGGGGNLRWTSNPSRGEWQFS